MIKKDSDDLNLEESTDLWRPVKRVFIYMKCSSGMANTEIKAGISARGRAVYAFLVFFSFPKYLYLHIFMLFVFGEPSKRMSKMSGKSGLLAVEDETTAAFGNRQRKSNCKSVKG